MKNNKVCPKCECTKIVIVANSALNHNYIAGGFLGLKYISVTRYICVGCGFSEEWIDDASDLEKLAKEYPFLN